MDAKKGASKKQLGRLAGCIDRGLNEVEAEQKEIREYVKDIEKIAATLEPGEDCADSQKQFEELIAEFKPAEDPVRQHIVRLMITDRCAKKVTRC